MLWLHLWAVMALKRRSFSTYLVSYTDSTNHYMFRLLNYYILRTNFRRWSKHIFIFWEPQFFSSANINFTGSGLFNLWLKSSMDFIIDTWYFYHVLVIAKLWNESTKLFMINNMIFSTSLRWKQHAYMYLKKKRYQILTMTSHVLH